MLWKRITFKAVHVQYIHWTIKGYQNLRPTESYYLIISQIPMKYKPLGGTVMNYQEHMCLHKIYAYLLQAYATIASG